MRHHTDLRSALTPHLGEDENKNTRRNGRREAPAR